MSDIYIVIQCYIVKQLFSPSSKLVENYRYLLYKYKLILNNGIELSLTYDPITHTVEELVEVRDSGCYSDIHNHNIVRVLLDQLYID